MPKNFVHFLHNWLTEYYYIGDTKNYIEKKQQLDVKRQYYVIIFMPLNIKLG